LLQEGLLAVAAVAVGLAEPDLAYPLVFLMSYHQRPRVRLGFQCLHRCWAFHRYRSSFALG